MDDVFPSARQQITCAQEDRGSLIAAAPSVRMTTGDTGPRPYLTITPAMEMQAIR